MRTFSASDLIVSCLIITQICGAETTGESKLSSNNVDQHNDQPGSSPVVQVPKLTELKQIHLDLDIERDTSDFYYKKTTAQSSYTPKPGRVFDKVIISVPYVFPVVIWEAKSITDCATEVSVFSVKSSLLVSINILMLNGRKKVFRRDPFGPNWEDITFPPDVQLLTVRDGKQVELDPSNYIVNPNCLYKYSYSFNLSPHAKCTEIKHKNKTVWKYGETYSSSEGEGVTTSFYPTSISYTIRYTFNKYYKIELEHHNFRISFSDGSYLDSSLENNEWKQTYYIWRAMTLPLTLDTATAITLDITFGESTEQFEHEYYYCPNTGYSDFRIFTAKLGYKFSSVKEINRLIWDNSKDPSEFSTKVVAQTSIKFPEQGRQVTIHTNKDNKIFYRPRGKENWRNLKELPTTFVPGLAVVTLNEYKKPSESEDCSSCKPGDDKSTSANGVANEKEEGDGTTIPITGRGTSHSEDVTGDKTSEPDEVITSKAEESTLENNTNDGEKEADPDESTSVNDNSTYDVVFDLSLVTYRFKPGAKCTSVLFNDKLVWKHDVGLYGDIYPTYLSFNTVSKNIRILINNTLYFYSLQNHEWNMVLQMPTQSQTINLIK